MRSVSRRRMLVSGAAAAASVLAGCTFGTASVDLLDGTVRNRSGTDRTVSVELIRSDGVVDFGRTYDLRPDDEIEFDVTDPATEYTLRTDVTGGSTKTEQWNSRDCRTVRITLRETEIQYGFDAC